MQHLHVFMSLQYFVCICVFVVVLELVPGFMALPVCLFDVSKHPTECSSSIGDILATKGLACSLSKQYLQYFPDLFIFLH